MKYVAQCLLTLTTFIVSVTLAASAQEAQTKQQSQETREKSNLEKFSARSGALLEKQFIELGQVRGVEVKILRITDLLTKASHAGVRIEQTVSKSYGNRTNIAFLDQDELEGLIKSIKHIQQSVMTSQRSSYTEIEFSSRGGFEVGCYYSDGKWQPYMQVSRYDRESMLPFSASDLSSLLTFLEGAKAKML